MKFETSDKTSSYGVKPHVPKGYYPGKLLQITEFTEKDGSPRVGKFGQQLIFEFAVYAKDAETGAPTKPLMFKPDKDKPEEYPVKISKFVYHKYKKTDKNDKWVDGEFVTAFTKNSAVTKLCEALGWTFSADGVDTDEFLGNWAELNLDDYIVDDGKASTIQKVNPYEGPAVSNVENVDATPAPKTVKKTVTTSELESPLLPETEEEIKKLQDKIEGLKTLYSEGSVSEEGINQAIEGLNVKIEALRKK